MTFNDNPPSYDSVTEGNDVAKSHETRDNKHSLGAPSMLSDSSPYTVHPGTASGSSPLLYHYRNPITQETVVSLLPPEYPSMVCLQAGEHDTQTNFGILGILAAVLWFPLGIGLCLLDRRVKCRRCGEMIQDGMCS
ncbi:hypothetical protein F5050DRAFT_1687351 [Lentinula boryana]|uniref:Brain protein I3 n=1 Tax=Lentinula boryana TaxID=40481 RepID=A0ABQ8QLB7_9AGAR|nr:hypothetical protein F5050DRAFT_1687351 [Lentinula boryana]